MITSVRSAMWTAWNNAPWAGANGDEGSQTLTYWIPEPRLPELQHKLDKLVRKAQRLGIGAVTYEVGAPENRPYVWEDGRYVVYQEGDPEDKIVHFRVFPVAVTGTTPRLAGWSFVGTLQHLKDDTGVTLNLLRTVPGFQGKLPEEFRHRDASNCDHCCRIIPWRKDTYIVRNDETGEFKQVGRHCTQDFLGGQNPQAIASYLESVFSAQSLAEEYGEESYGGWGRAEIQYPISEFLTQTAAVVRVEGWLSRGKARYDEYGPPATADTVLYVLPPPPFDRKERKEWEKVRERLAPTEVDAETAEKALEYAREFLSNKPDRDDYEHNLYVATTQPMIGSRLVGITASLIPYYLRHVERLVERERARTHARESEHFGVVGERSDYYVTPLKVIPVESMYGMSYLHKFLTREGNIAMWFASRNPELEIGKEYRVKATIKKHDEYQGTEQTFFTRVTVLTEEKRKLAEEKEARKIAREAKRAAKAMAKEAKEKAKAKGALGLPPDVVEHYIGNDADIFALALHEELGLPTVGVCGYVRTGSGHLERAIVHVAAGLPDGHVVDASGVVHPEELLDAVEWYFGGEDVEDIRIEPVSFAEVEDVFGPVGYDDIAEAREYARLVVEG
jgi:hypothetical protein